MKTRKFYVGLSFLTLIGLLFVACEKENIVEAEDHKANTRTGEYRISPEELAYVGEQHNAQLDALYDAYVADGVGEAEFLDYTHTYLLDEIVADGSMYPELAEIANENVNNFFENPIPDSYPSLYSGLEGDLTIGQMAYLDDLYAILSTESITVEALNVEVSDLEATISADMTMTNDHLFVLFSATQMAKHSYEYWMNEGDKWNDLGGEELPEAEAKSAGEVAGDIATADVATAAGAAVVAVGTNIIVGPGTVAYGTAIIGGAVGGSVASGVKKFINWLRGK